MRLRYCAWNLSVPPRMRTQYASMKAWAILESRMPPSTSMSQVPETT